MALVRGLIAHFNIVGIILNIAVVDNFGVALKYREFLRDKLELIDRRRAVNVDYLRLLFEGRIDIRRRFPNPPNPSGRRPTSAPPNGGTLFSHTITIILE